MHSCWHDSKPQNPRFASTHLGIDPRYQVENVDNSTLFVSSDEVVCTRTYMPPKITLNPHDTHNQEQSLAKVSSTRIYPDINDDSHKIHVASISFAVIVGDQDPL